MTNNKMASALVWLGLSLFVVAIVASFSGGSIAAGSGPMRTLALNANLAGLILSLSGCALGLLSALSRR